VTPREVTTALPLSEFESYNDEYSDEYYPECQTPILCKETQEGWMPVYQCPAFAMIPMAQQVAKLKASGIKKPKAKQDLSEFKTHASAITTLMIRGIPCSFSQEELLSVVDSAGLAGKYDFFYMPRAGKTTSNLGYAFINFVQSTHAWTCAYTFNDVRLDPSRSTKVCSVTVADIQGITNLRKHFRRSVVSRGPNAPMFFRGKDRNKKICNRKLKPQYSQEAWQ
jgi:RNA recognition motif-containing protein